MTKRNRKVYPIPSVPGFYWHRSGNRKRWEMTMLRATHMPDGVARVEYSEFRVVGDRSCATEWVIVYWDNKHEWVGPMERPAGGER